jgi:hypothetical protein
MEFGEALISGGVSLVVATIVAVTTVRLERERLRTELRTEFMAEAAIRALLSVDDLPLRSFEKIRHHVGGFEDPELRRLLIRSGALRFKARDGSEMWGLRDRNLDRLVRKKASPNEIGETVAPD